MRVYIFFAFILLVLNVAGQCDKFILKNDFSGGFQDLQSISTPTSPILKFKNTKDSGIVAVVTKKVLMEPGDKLVFVDINNNTYSFDILTSRIKRRIAGKKIYEAVAQLNYEVIKLFSKNPIRRIQLFNRSSVTMYPSMLGRNTRNNLKKVFACFYEQLDSLQVRDKKISSYLNVLTTKIENTDTVPTTLSVA